MGQNQPLTLKHDLVDVEFVDLEVYRNKHPARLHLRLNTYEKCASKASLKNDESFNFETGSVYTYCNACLKHPELPVQSKPIQWHKGNLTNIKSDTFHVNEWAVPCVHDVQKVFQYFNQYKTAFEEFLQYGNRFLENIQVPCESLPVVIIPTEEEEQKQRKKPQVFTYAQLKDGASKINNDKTNADNAAWVIQAFKQATADIEIVQKREIMIIRDGELIESTDTKWAKTVRVISACSKLIGAAAPLVEIALALLALLIPPTPSKKNLGENEMRKFVYEETSEALHGVTWSEFKKNAQGAMEAYRDATYFVNDPEKFEKKMEEAKSEGSNARRHISNYRVNEDKMYAQLILYAEVATIELLALTFLSRFSENYRKILSDNVEGFKAELSKIHEDAETGTKSSLKDALEKCECDWEGEEHFVLDKNHDADKLVKNFCELWDELIM